VNLEKQLPAVIDTSADAQLGTQKHAQTTAAYQSGITSDQPDVAWCVDQAKEVVSALPPETVIVHEYQVDLQFLGIDPSPDGCRCDLVAFVPGSFALLIDWKYGAGYVDAPEWNTQMKAYATGIARSFGVPQVLAMILQPNAQNEDFKRRSYTFDAAGLATAETEIRAIIEATKKPDAPLVRGDHCADRFCRCRPVCQLWRDAFLSVPKNTSVANYMLSLSPEKRRDIYENLLAAKKFCTDAIEAVKELAVAGSLEIAGYEIGDGKKSREWKDEGVAKINLCSLASGKGLSSDDVIKPISIAKAEELFGKGKFKDQTLTVPGKPMLKKST
jgi:hypothetical protein